MREENLNKKLEKTQQEVAELNEESDRLHEKLADNDDKRYKAIELIEKENERLKIKYMAMPIISIFFFL